MQNFHETLRAEKKKLYLAACDTAISYTAFILVPKYAWTVCSFFTCSASFCCAMDTEMLKSHTSVAAQNLFRSAVVKPVFS